MGASAGDADEFNPLTALRSGESANDTLRYTVSDGHGNEETATVIVTVEGRNDGADDEFVARPTKPLVVPAKNGVLVNDPLNDPEVDVARSDKTSLLGVPVTWHVDQLVATGGFTYDPTALDHDALVARSGEGGVVFDSFEYTTRDKLTGATLTATVVVAVDVLNPECDFNADGNCHTADIDLLMNAVAHGVPTEQFDLNADGVVDDGDRDDWLVLAAFENDSPLPYQLGDSNLDGRVDSTDLNVVGRNWRLGTNDWTRGNFTGSGVDAADLHLLGMNWQRPQLASLGVQPLTTAGIVTVDFRPELVISTPSIPKPFTTAGVDLVVLPDNQIRVNASISRWTTRPITEVVEVETILGTETVSQTRLLFVPVEIVRTLGTFSGDGFYWVRFTGSNGRDVLTVPSDSNILVFANGRGGDDYLQGGSGFDVLDGGDGDDTLIGNGGYDTLSGGSGNDQLFGGVGDDNLIGGEGDDLLDGGADNDRLEGGLGADIYQNSADSMNPSLLVGANRSEGDRFAIFTSDTRISENLALHKRTSGQSDFLRSPSNGVDGNTDSFTHTGNIGSVFWEVDLASASDVGRIEVVNRGDCCGERLNGAILKVLGADRATIFTTPIFGATTGATLVYDNGGAGFADARYIRIEHNNQYLSIAEVRAFAPQNLIVGVKSERQTLEDLKSTDGVLVASLVESLEPGRDVLTINGPTLHGFTLTGDWDHYAGDRFVSNGPLMMSTGLGNLRLPLPSRTALVIPTISDHLPNAGQINPTAAIDMFFGAIGSLLEGAGGGVTNVLADFFRDDVGLGFQGLANVRFGLALGKEIAETLNPAPPVVASLPYFYFQLAVGTNLVSFGNNSISQGNGFDTTIVFDPTDPYLFAKVSVSGGGYVAAAGGSKNGYIPFSAAYAPSKFRTGGVDTVDIYGHLYLEGKFPLGVVSESPKMEVSGELSLVVDLDANDDGIVAGVIDKGRRLSEILDVGDVTGNHDSPSFLDVFDSVLSDLEVGINGKLNAELTLPGRLNLGLTIPMGSATAIMKDDIFAFAGSSADPFEGTFLDDIIEAPSSVIDAFVDRGNGDFEVSYSQQPGEFLGMTIPGFAYSSIRVNNTGATFTQEFPVLGLRPYLRGVFSFDTGTVALTASLQTRQDFGPFHANAELRFRLANYVGYHWVGNNQVPTWGLSFTGHLAAEASIELGSTDLGLFTLSLCDFAIGVGVDFRFAASSSGIAVSGSASAHGSACGYSFNYSTGTVSTRSSGISVSWDLPDPFPNLHLSL